MFHVAMRPVLGAATAAVGVLAVASPSSAAGNWQAPQLIGHHLSSPSMVTTWFGVDHVVARGENGIWAFTNRNGGWSGHRLTQDTVATVDGKIVHTSAASPVITVDGHATLVAAYGVRVRQTGQSGDCTFQEIRLVRHEGGHWSAPEAIPNSSCQAPTSIVSRNGTVAVATIGANARGRRAISYFTNASGSWTHVTVATGSVGGGQLSPASLVVAKDGKPMLAYIAAGHLVYARGATPSGHFSHLQLARTGGHAMPSLALYSGLPMVAWSDAAGSHYSYADADGDWYARRVMDGSIQTALTFDAMGHPNMAAADAAGGLHYATRANGAWHSEMLDSHTVLRVGGITAVNGATRVLYQRGSDVFYESTFPGC